MKKMLDNPVIPNSCKGAKSAKVIQLLFTPLHLCVILIFTLLLPTKNSFSQQVNVEHLGQDLKDAKPVHVGGGISANTIFYDGNDAQQRQPFTYVLNGNLNLNLYNKINLPFSFNFNNLGANYSYPTLPNRLSVHPTYKWITGHIGDIAMTFSPYTLNGHQFTGMGLDLAPEGPFKISAMAGRLIKSVEYDTMNVLVPAAYQRFGYGTKVRYDQADYYVGMSFFSARDNVNSLEFKPDSLHIFPESNVAFSWETGIKLTDHLIFSGEYGLSLMTRDIRSPDVGDSWIQNVLNNKTSTETFKASRFQVEYQFGKSKIGGGYERIDPQYRTLGAYYFNNDYENLTINFSSVLWKEKFNLAVTWGVQRDNLEAQSEQSTRRFVGSVNLNYTPNEKFSTSLSYSSFQSYMNLRSDFQYINGVTPYDNLDTLNFTQLSTNITSNINYNFGKNEDRKQNINANISYQEAADKRGDIVSEGNLTQFYNTSLVYSMLWVPEAIGLHVSINSTYNHLQSEDVVILGPTVGVNARVLKKRATTGGSISYNISMSQGSVTATVLNTRANFSYRFLKHHTAGTNIIWQKRELISRNTSTSSIISTITYTYNF